MKRFAIIIFALIFMSGGCKKGKEEKKGESQSTKRTAEVVVPKEVSKQWKSVRIQLVDRNKNEKSEYEIEIGKSLALGDSGITVDVIYFLPDFKMGPGEITSASAEPKNPAAQVAVKEGNNEIKKLWLFYNYPDIHAFQHPRYQLALTGFTRK